MNDNVNHPAHYNIPGRKECIVEMMDVFGIEKVEAFCELNAYKYQYRHELKNGEEDLDKARWYKDKLEILQESDPRFQIADHYGLDAQLQQLIEEMSELTQAICKYFRKHGKGQQTPIDDMTVEENLMEELADVKLVHEQVLHLLCGERIVQSVVKNKIERQLERMEEENG